MKSKLGIISILVSLICIFLTIKTNLLIAETFSNTKGKTRALFGIIELRKFSYKYYYLLLSISSFSFAWVYSKVSENMIMKISCFSLSILSGVLVFLRIWTWIVNQFKKRNNYCQQRFLPIAGLALAIFVFVENNLVATTLSFKENPQFCFGQCLQQQQSKSRRTLYESLFKTISI